MMRLFYTIITFVIMPALWLRLVLRSRRQPAYRRRMWQRLGFVPHFDRPSIWLHAVSLGESVAATPLIKQLLKDYPSHHIIITNTTPTGAGHIQKTFGRSVHQFFLPFDLPGIMRRFARRTNAQCVIIMETELWPNLCATIRRLNLTAVLANARLSARSCRRYQMIPSLSQYMLNSFHTVIAQSVADGERFVQCGLTPSRLRVSGNIKFDLTLEQNIHEQGQACRQQWRSLSRPTLIGASTHEQEETLLLTIAQQLRTKIPDLLLILVPRHPERFARVKQLCQQQGVSLAQRSQNENPVNQEVYLADTLGELRLLYSAADVAFVGGTWVPVGGHSLIEPAALGLPIVCGPYVDNCQQVAHLLQQAQGLQVIDNRDDLVLCLLTLLQQPDQRRQYGRHAAEVVLANQGALATHLRCIHALISSEPTVRNDCQGIHATES